MKPKSTLRSFLLLAGSSLLAISYSHAATLYWDGSTPAGDPNGGTGSWDTSTANWDTALTGGSAATWNNATPDSAIFGGMAGTVSLTTGITVNGLQFDTTGYILASDDGLKTLSLATGTNTILFNSIAAASTSSGGAAGLKLGGTGNVILTASNPATAGTLTLQYSVAANSSDGWSGTTTINPGMTLALAGRDLSLSSTTGITLNGGGITLTNTNGTQGAFDRVSSAGITSNGGTITYANSSVAAGVYTETIGSMALTTGQLNIVENTTMANGLQAQNNQTLTLGGLTQSGTSAVTFSALTTGPQAAGNRNMIVVSGAGTTAGWADAATSNSIHGPWATVGTAANAQTDYAVFSGGYVIGANTTGSLQGTWTDSTKQFTNNTSAVALSGNRTMTALRNTAATATITLSDGATGYSLATNGVLNGVGTTLTIAPGTVAGSLTAPGGSGGNIFLTTGSGAITVSAPINDNGGAVTVVQNGAGILTLSSTTSNFSGGIVLNAGTLSINANTNLGSGGGITVNGTASIDANDQYSLARSLTLNDGALLSLGDGFGVTGVFSGNGALNVTTADDFIFANSANTYTGPITSATASNTGYGLKFNSIGDTAGAGLITLVGGSGTFHWMSDSGSTTTLANRQFAISGTGSGMISARGTTAASDLVINKDLLITGAAGARGLQLGGTNLGNNTFAGKIADGTDGGASVVSLTKAEAGKWILTGANTYSGGTTISAGTLVVSNASALGTGTVNVAGGTLESTVGDLSSNRFTAGGGGTITPSLGGSLGFTKFGSGTLNLNGTSNTFTGGITVGGGTLAVGASSSLGQNVIGNSILIRDAGILTLAAAANSGSNQAITLSSSSKSGAAVSQSAGGAGPTGRLAVLGLGFNGLPNGAISQANTNGGVIAINAVTGYNIDLSSVLTGKNLFLGAIGTSTFTGAAGTVVAGNGSLYRLGGGGGTLTFNTENLFTGGNGVQVGSTFLNGGGTVVIQAAQNYTGATTVSQGTLTLSGANGSATGSSGFTLNGGRLFLDSGTNNNADRIGTVAVTLSNAGELHLSGNSAGTTETIGDLNIGTGYSTVTSQASTVASTLAAGAFNRTGNGTALFRGTALGQQTGARGLVTLSDTTGLTFVGATTLNNAPNSDATKDVRIIPYLVGGTSANNTGDTFITYDTTLGFRVLTTANQFNSTITANTNVRLAAAATGITSNTINSLIHTTGSSTIADGATLTVTSGALLFTGGNINQAGTTGILDFGANTGFITTTGNSTIGARITGSGGLVKSGASTLTLSNSNNSFTGDIIVNSGTLSVGNNNGMLGNAANNIIVNGHSTLNLNGISYARSLELNNGAIATFSSENWTISGNVTGTGGVAFNAGGFSAGGTFSGTSNTFEGPVLIGGSGAGNLNHRVTFASLADSASANGRIIFLASNVNGATGSRFEYTGGTGGNTSLTLNNRQIELASTVAGPTAGHQIMNSSAGTGTLTINTDLIVSTPIEQTLSLRGSNTGANSFNGKIVDGDGKVSVIKADAGTWLLNGINTYTGLTSVNAGTLGGNGSIAGSMTVAAAGSLAPGATLVGAGTLTIGSGLDISAQANGGAGKLKFELGANTAASDQIAVTGTLTTGGKLGFSDFTFTDLPGGPQNGVYTLITTGTSTAAALDSVGLSGTIGVGGTGTLSASGNNIILTVTGLAGGDVTPPTLASSDIVDDKTGGPVTVNTLVTYTVTFSEDMDASTVAADDFGNAGTATVTIGTVTETTPGVFTVQATPTSTGTLILKVNAGAVLTDTSGNPLNTASAIADNTTITVQTPYEAWAGGAAFDADANGDGVKNGLAFLLGASSPSGAVTLPTVAQSGGALTLSFSMRNSIARGTASLNVQHSSDLGISDAWDSALVPDSSQTVNDVVFTISPGTPLNGVVATIPVSKAASGKLFGRLKGQP